MTYLLADIGGTNSRLALVDPSGVKSLDAKRYRNHDFKNLDDLLNQFLSDNNHPALDAVCIAVAGPIYGDGFRLTNRNWSLSRAQITALAGTDTVFLINDLSALALGLPQLRPQHIAGPELARIGQFLVVGMGTGFNVSPAMLDADSQATAFATELGHSSLPAPVLSALNAEIPESCKLFETLEDCFCGPGLERLFKEKTGRTEDSAEIMRIHASGQDPEIDQTVALFSRMLGVLCRELVFCYLPQAGMVFAGSVSARIFLSRAKEEFFEAFLAPVRFPPNPDAIPIALIADDSAALWGCLNHIRRNS